MNNVEVFQSEDDQWRFRIKGDNGEIVAASEGYVSETNASRGAKNLKRILDEDAGLNQITKERARVISEEQHHPEHDIGRSDELIAAARCYLAHAEGNMSTDHLRMLPKGWPWAREFWKPGTKQRDLEKAGALVAAALSAHMQEKEEA